MKSNPIYCEYDATISCDKEATWELFVDSQGDMLCVGHSCEEHLGIMCVDNGSGEVLVREIAKQYTKG